MSAFWAWVSYGVLAVCLVGGVAWPLWSDNDLWMIAFGAIGAVAVIPAVVWPSIRACATRSRTPPNEPP